MYQRITKELSWPDREEKSVHNFNVRSGDGLTSVYYRVRKHWGMREVLKTRSGSSSDRTILEERANHFSNDFLEMLGYFDQANVSWFCEGTEACPKFVASSNVMIKSS